MRLFALPCSPSAGYAAKQLAFAVHSRKGQTLPRREVWPGGASIIPPGINGHLACEPLKQSFCLHIAVIKERLSHLLVDLQQDSASAASNLIP